MLRPILILLAAAVLAGCANPAARHAIPPASAAEGVAERIYFGGTIITINDAQPSAEAVAIADGRILAVGDRSDVEARHRGAATEMVDLDGRTLLPGFIDPHSHFMDALSLADRVNVSAPPVGTAASAADIVDLLRAAARDKDLAPGELLLGYGYDENLMPDGQLLSRDLLDAAFPDNPVAVIHVSKHGAVLNSRAFARYGYADGMPTPPGGVILRKEGTQELQGLVMEAGFLPMFSQLPTPGIDTELEAARAGQMLYAAAGVTTAQEGATHAHEVEQLQRIARQGGLFMDLVTYPFILDLDTVLAANPPSRFGTYSDHLKLGGCKITADGSPQGKTAWFTTPYLTGGPAGEADWKGEPGLPLDVMLAGVQKCYDNDLQVLIHGNGDAAIDFLIEAHEKAARGDLARDRRTVAIHAQFVRPDQLEAFARYGIIPSLFTDHTFFFGDTHIRNRGLEQASFISPMRSAYAAGLRPTNHTDAFVVPVNQMMTVWTAVNRTTRSGVLLGPEERITPLQALKAITINAAYQYFEESSKGSIEPGKRADLVILDADPLTVEPMSIKDIAVLETIKDGRTIYASTGRERM
ncbi:amidohydrolase [Dokdonella sp.]|uniref:amidohydrolase n=1 Tax=Dokdonella sp. TaxID=2291710 RepID=UPI0031CBEBE1|nr:amidohydrolase [Dokdonella sp.]